MDFNIVKAWINNDPDEKDQVKLQELLAKAEANDATALAELENSFAGELTFGTAGIRGKLGPGPNRMNRAVVRRTAYGLATFLKDKIGTGFTVVIGYDARHGSHDFAFDTAAIVTELGGKADIFANVMPTPVTSFAVKVGNYDAGVMVTASHNPAQDNGYKVYLGGRVVSEEAKGVQIIEPFDKEIFAYIQKAPLAKDIKLATTGWKVLDDSYEQQYLDMLKQQIPSMPSDLKIVYTPMHGVGGDISIKALKNAGFTNIYPVTEQLQPDPDFPTVYFPNPEEKGALDLAIALAKKVDADIIIANDPDADRAAVVVPDPQDKSKWVQLTGDEFGVVLAEQLAAEYAGQDVCMATSIVSSQLLETIAKTYNINCYLTLTGFKWIARIPKLIYGYEESIGYCISPRYVGDKDGIGVLIKIAQMVAENKAKNISLLELVDRLALKYGLYKTGVVSVRVEDLSLIKKTMAKLRTEGIKELAGSKVTTVYDLAKSEYRNLPVTDGLVFITDDKTRLIVRPSGTEPKLKFYIEVIIPTDSDLTQAKTAASAKIAKISAEVKALMVAA